MKVSVIIAAYNCQDYIDKSIQSILSQSFNDLEIIVCDDASTDSTNLQLEKYHSYENIKFLKNEKNMYSGATRNKCLAVAKGKYIAIQDADDYSDMKRIEKQVEFLDNNIKYDFVGTGLYTFDEQISPKKITKPEKPSNEDFLTSTPFSHATLMFKREVLEHVNGYKTTKRVRRVEDYDLMMRLYTAGYIGYNISEALYYYRIDEETYRRRRFIYRVDEMIIRYRGYKNLNLFPKGYIYVLKPILVGVLPSRIYIGLKNRD